MSISVIIVTKNEAHSIHDCLCSVSWANEIIVVDSGSQDKTVEIAKKLGAKVIETDWPGYGPQQNRAIDSCCGEWIFSIDADERVTPELKDEILQVIMQEKYMVYDIPRKSFFVTKFMNHSGWWPDRTRRLFKRNFARFTTHEIHANLSTQSKVGHLKSHMIHFSYKNYDEVLEKINRYSGGSARDMHANKKKGSLPKALLHGFWAFVRTYFLKLGFLDGQAGVILAIANAESSYYKYLKLMMLSNQK
jgi:glycosyltransferase involved in cell wall biosynthesis